MSDATPDISIIIPTKNAGARLERVLASIFRQKSQYLYDVIAIDSGSTDGTLETLRKYPVAVTQIAAEQFSHSRTRNYGASLSTARKYYVFLNQDAIPTDEHWLDNLVYSMGLEAELKAVCAAELDENAQVFNVAGVAAFLFKNSLVKGIYIIEPFLERNWSGLPKYRFRQMFPFTTVCAIFNKEHFNRYPFDENTGWGEDLHWAVHNSRRGYKSACSNFAQVYHNHDYTDEELKDIVKRSNLLFENLFGVAFNDQSAQMMSGYCSMTIPDWADSILQIQQSALWKILRPLLPVYKILRKGRLTGS
ncbi:glycosyltransferase family A protein [Geotalea sp. SG265]|uniref:glycosyltransferase family A protein n=1 Tax=Geotalea sp. SG265 TaxID=2922867 RepID=UPI001FAF1691|nr:glycosyltransferase family A protein [Geotalea sp. SG265]